jgi:hypothetical protein
MARQTKRPDAVQQRIAADKSEADKSEANDDEAAGHPARQPKTGEQTILLNTTPGWLNWAAVTLAVLIVAGILILSARQLNAPQPGVSANVNNGSATNPAGAVQAGFGGMQLDAGGEDANNVQSRANGEQLLLDLEPGLVLMNRADRIQLYADADIEASPLDSYARGGTFVVVEPTGDFDDYPIVVDEVQWVRVRAGDGLVGWTPMDALEPAP